MAKIRLRDTITKYEQIIRDLDNKIYRPVYLLTGEEPFYIDALNAYMSKNILTESERAFNQFIIYGNKDITAKDIVLASLRLPMMANYQLVIVREAQNVKKFDELEVYLKSPVLTTILVICYKDKTFDKRTKIYKEIEKCGEILESAKAYENELPAWITNYLKNKGYAIDASASSILSDFIGNNLTRIANELDKLFTLLAVGNKKITAEHIEKNIGISKEYNTFELNKAIMTKNKLKAYRIADYFSKNPNDNPITMTISALFMQFCRLLKLQALKFKYPKGIIPQSDLKSIVGIDAFFLKEYEDAAKIYSENKIVAIIELLREYDMRSKGWNNDGTYTSDSELLREMIFKIMN
jgi:DNA polymerase-3 subunit delta